MDTLYAHHQGVSASEFFSTVNLVLVDVFHSECSLMTLT
jgi:hypothetical protein